MRHGNGNLGHGWQSSTYEVGNEGHEKLKLAMTDMWLVKRDMRLTMTDISPISYDLLKPKDKALA